MRNYFKETDQVVRRELRRIVRQPMYWVLMVVLPVVSFAFFAVIFERGVARNIPIAVLDEDHTTLSRKVTQMIDDTPTAMVSYEVQSMEEAQRLMREGRIRPSSTFRRFSRRTSSATARPISNVR